MAVCVWDERDSCAPLSGCLLLSTWLGLPPTPRRAGAAAFCTFSWSSRHVRHRGAAPSLIWIPPRFVWLALADPHRAILLVAHVGTLVGKWYAPEYVAANQCAERIMDQPSPQRVVETEQVLVSVSISLCGPPRNFFQRGFSPEIWLFESVVRPSISGSVCVLVCYLPAEPRQWWMFVLKAARQVNSREWRKIFIGLV